MTFKPGFRSGHFAVGFTARVGQMQFEGELATGRWLLSGSYLANLHRNLDGVCCSANV